MITNRLELRHNLEEVMDLIKILSINLTITFLKINPELIMKHILKGHQKREKVKIYPELSN
jgi:hypothetical protein